MPLSFQFSLLIQVIGKYVKAVSLDTYFTDSHGLWNKKEISSMENVSHQDITKKIIEFQLVNYLKATGIEVGL